LGEDAESTYARAVHVSLVDIKIVVHERDMDSTGCQGLIPSRRDPEFFFGRVPQPTEECGCTVGGFAETTARHRGKNTGGFTTTTTTTTTDR